MSLYGGRDLVAPGAMTKYDASAGRRPKQAGYVRVNKSPDGFFVAGSALEGINGLYGRVKTVPQRLAKSHSFQLAYKHDQSNWYMALVECPLDHMGNKAEWLFIDDEGRDRFAHVGDTVVPGSGKRWKFVSRTAPRPQHADDDSDEGDEDEDYDDDEDWERMPDLLRKKKDLVKREPEQEFEDNEDNLPWQLIAILSEDMLEQLRNHYRYYEYECRAARTGASLAKIELGPRDSQEQAPAENFKEHMYNGVEVAEDALKEGRFDEALELFTTITVNLPDDSPSNTSMERWCRAYLQLQLGRCHRHLSSIPAAFKSINSALRLFPCYTLALVELGITNLDLGDGYYQEAINCFERALRLDRTTLGSVDHWLMRAHAHLRREKLFSSKGKWKAKIMLLENKDLKLTKAREKAQKEAMKKYRLQQRIMAKKMEKKIEKRELKEEARRVDRREAKLIAKMKAREKTKAEAKALDDFMINIGLTNSGGNEGGDEGGMPPLVPQTSTETGLESSNMPPAPPVGDAASGGLAKKEKDKDKKEKEKEEDDDDEDEDEDEDSWSSDYDNSDDSDESDSDDSDSDSDSDVSSVVLSEHESDKEDIDEDEEEEASAAVPNSSSPGGGGINGDANSDSDIKRFSSFNHYMVLGVPSDFSAEELKKAYRKVSRTVHPDRRGGSTAAFQRVADAYKTLEDEALRVKFDEGCEVKAGEFELKQSRRKVKKEREMQRLMNRSSSYGNRGRHNFGYGDDEDSDEDRDEEERNSEDDEEEAKKDLKEEIDRKYFPERYEWAPFGDPHENKKKSRR